MGKIDVNLQYPYDDKFNYESRLIKLNLDEEREKSIMSGHGFRITEVQSNLKKDLKNPNGIYSSRFGQTLQDMKPFEDRYRCNCGTLRGRLLHGITCRQCATKVQYVDDDFGYFGWLVLDELWTIHPNLYKLLQSFIGASKLDNILKFVDQKDENGKSVPRNKLLFPKEEPFTGLGLSGFKNNIIEILDFYNKSTKRDKYEELMSNLDNMFTQSLPVKVYAA